MTSFKTVAIADRDAIFEERPRSVCVIPRSTDVVPVAIIYCHRDRSVERKCKSATTFTGRNSKIFSCAKVLVVRIYTGKVERDTNRVKCLA